MGFCKRLILAVIFLNLATVAHEFGHACAALACDVKIDGIDLGNRNEDIFLLFKTTHFGQVSVRASPIFLQGVTYLNVNSLDKAKPSSSIIISAAGLAVNLFLATACLIFKGKKWFGPLLFSTLNFFLLFENILPPANPNVNTTDGFKIIRLLLFYGHISETTFWLLLILSALLGIIFAGICFTVIIFLVLGFEKEDFKIIARALLPI